MLIMSNETEKNHNAIFFFAKQTFTPHLFFNVLIRSKNNTDIYDQILICNKCFKGKKRFIATITPTLQATSRAIRHIHFFSRSKEMP